MKKASTRGRKLLFLSPLLFLAIMGGAWMRRETAPLKTEPVALDLPNSSYVTALEFSPECGRLLVFLNNAMTSRFTARIYDLNSRALICELEMSPVTKVGARSPSSMYHQPSWSPDGKRVVCSLWKLDGDNPINQFEVWNAGDGRVQMRQRYKATASNSYTEQFRFSSDGKTISGEGIPPIRFDAASGKRLNQFDTGIDQRYSKLNEKLGLVATRSGDSEDVKVVDLQTKRILWKPPVTSATFTWGGDMLCVSDAIPQTSRPSIKNRLLLWNGKTRQLLPSPPFPSSSGVKSLQFLPDGKTLAYSYSHWTRTSEQGAIAVWDFSRQRMKWRYPTTSVILSDLKTSPDGRWLTACEEQGNNSTLYLFDQNGHLYHKYAPVESFTRWASDSKQLATIRKKTDKAGNVISNRIEIQRVGE